MRENRYRSRIKIPEDWKPSDWDRALRETIKLRKEITGAMLAEAKNSRKGRSTDTAVDPRHASRAAGVLSLVQSKTESQVN